MGIIRTIGTVLILGLVATSAIQSCNSPSKAKHIDPREPYYKDAASCHVALKKKLRDPDSWQEKTWSVVTASKDPKIKYSIWFEGRAKNGFGGYAPLVAICDVNSNGSLSVSLVQ